LIFRLLAIQKAQFYPASTLISECSVFGKGACPLRMFARASRRMSDQKVTISPLWDSGL